MKTDISLLSKVNNRKIIIDAKYYADTLVDNFGFRKFRSGHLNQLFAYLNHSSNSIVTQGILLYPTNGITVDEIYSLPIIVGNELVKSKIFITTLNLNQKWFDISKQLLRLLDK